MSVIVNPRDILMQATPTRLLPITLPPNLTVPGLDELTPNLDSPPTPTGFSVSAALTSVSIFHDPPVFLQGHGYAYTKVYARAWGGGNRPTFGNAVEVGTFIGQVESIPAQPAQTYHVWVTWVSKDGIESPPAGGVNGQVASTGEDVERLVAAMTGPGKPFTVVNTPTTLSDGTIVPAGTYTADAFMGRFVAGRGQIGLLAVDDARIASVKVDKLIAGTLQVGAYIASSNFVDGVQGFALWADGNAQLNNLRMRGEINGGAMNGYGWPAFNQFGFHLGPNGLLLGNANNGRYFQATSTGEIYMPGLTVANGSATFSGALAAASGTFRGSLTADAVNAVSTINIAGNAVTVPASTGGNGYGSVGITCEVGQNVTLIAVASSTQYPGGTTVNIEVNGGVIASDDASPVISSITYGGDREVTDMFYSVPPVTVIANWLAPYTGYFAFACRANGLLANNTPEPVPVRMTVIHTKR